jgi:hypothetical protein
MILALISLLLWIPAILGIGDLAHFPYRAWISKERNETIVEIALLGFALISAIANWGNLFFPITAPIQVFILLLGWGRFLYNLRKKNFNKLSVFITFSALILGVALSFLRANIVPSHYDSGYYGLQNVLWYNASPIPLGLANLHARFAYNSAWLAIASVIQFPIKDFFSSGELLLWFISFIMLFSIESSISKKWSPSIIYGLAISLTFLTPVLGTFSINSLTTDYPVFWLTIALGIHHTYALWFTTLISFWGITLKLSAFPLFFIALSQYYIEKDNLKAEFSVLIKSIFPLSFFSLFPWVTRYFLMSGCFFYPISFSCIPGIKWGVPIDSVKWMKDYIQQFSINYTLIPADIPLIWFTDKNLLQDWFHRYFSYSETWILLFFLLFSITIYLVSWRKKGENRKQFTELILLLPHIAGIVFWFYTVPSPRFGIGYLWGSTLFLLSLSLYYLLQDKSDKSKKLIITFLQALFAGLFLASIIRRVDYLLVHNQVTLFELAIQGSTGCSKTAHTLSESSFAESFLSGSRTFRLA